MEELSKADLRSNSSWNGNFDRYSQSASTIDTSSSYSSSNTQYFSYSKLLVKINYLVYDRITTILARKSLSQELPDNTSTLLTTHVLRRRRKKYLLPDTGARGRRDSCHRWCIDRSIDYLSNTLDSYFFFFCSRVRFAKQRKLKRFCSFFLFFNLGGASVISFLCKKKKKKGKRGQHKIGYIRKSEQNFLRLNIHGWSLILSLLGRQFVCTVLEKDRLRFELLCSLREKLTIERKYRCYHFMLKTSELEVRGWNFTFRWNRILDM